MINVLDKNTIDKIAAGEVIERPASVVKELVENAVDAGANAVTVEIKDGGLSLIRVTDNGSGIAKDDIKVAFLRHATSKIKDADDLFRIKSLGFRGEALSSIAVISKVELLTKTKDDIVGNRYVIEGGDEILLEPAGCPDGTTFLVKDIFYNTPVRRKFLKSATTETGFVCEIVEKLALCNPYVSFKFISNGRVLLHTSGKGKIKDDFLELYGLDTAKALIDVYGEDKENNLTLSGVTAKPYVSRGNRDYEAVFINGRLVKNKLIQSAIEDAYKGYMMGHNFPVTALFFDVPTDFVDINVHPTKLEIRFTDNDAVYRLAYDAVRNAITEKNLIVNVEKTENELQEEKKQKSRELNSVHIPEAFEVEKEAVKADRKIEDYKAADNATEAANNAEAANVSISANTPKPSNTAEPSNTPEPANDAGSTSALESANAAEPAPFAENTSANFAPSELSEKENEVAYEPPKTSDLLKKDIVKDAVQEEMDMDLYRGNKKEFRLIGQVFKTYWLIEMNDVMYMVDQHAAHEKILYERTMKRLNSMEKAMTQEILPEIVSFSMREAEVLRDNMEFFEEMGFEIEEFGGTEFRVSGVPADYPTIDYSSLLHETIENILSDRDHKRPVTITSRVATISCKAAVKGNTKISFEEAEKLIQDMLVLDNPYHCPHGRPTTILMTKNEIEKRFKRIV